MSNNELTTEKMTQALGWAYEKALNGIPGDLSSESLAKSYMKKFSSTDEAIHSLIKWQTAKSSTSGFVTGLGGIVTLPVAVPVNIASVLYVQMRMIAAIAYMRGYDLKDDQVQTFVFICLTGQAASDILKQSGITVGTKLTVQLIKKVPGATLTKINQKVAFRLVTKFGEKGVINLGKLVPVVGGVIGASVDGVGTKIIGNQAKKLFVELDSSVI